MCLVVLELVRSELHGFDTAPCLRIIEAERARSLQNQESGRGEGRHEEGGVKRIEARTVVRVL